MKAFFTLFALLLLNGYLYSQGRYEIRGMVLDTSGIGIGGATVKLTSTNDSVSVRTSDDGEFVLPGIIWPRFLLTISNLGYQTIEKDYDFDGSRCVFLLEPLILQSQSYELDQISILAKRAVIIKKDTIEYQARNYRLRENAFTEDLLKKLPGISISRDGNLIAQGKMVTRVKVNGKDFFGGDVETAIKNIPANLIEKIQVIDDYGDKARLTGGTDGRYQKIINIKTWANLRKGYFGNASAGNGNEGRYQFSALGNYFNNNRETAFYGNLNNNNAGMPGAEYALNSAMNGLTTVSATGFNYREKYNKAISSYGSYSFSKIRNDLRSETFRQNIYPDNILIFNNDTTNNKSVAYNHIFQWTMEYEDSLNFIQVSPVFNFNKRNTNRDAFLTQSKQNYFRITDSLEQFTLERMSSSAPLISSRIVGNHKFGKSGRNLFAEVVLRSSNNTSEQNTNAMMLFYDKTGSLTRDSVQRQFLKNENQSFSTTARLSYIEPLNKNSRIELGYAFGYSNYINDREAHRADIRRKIDSLSNRYAYSFTTNTVSLSLRHNGAKHSYTVGVSIQPTLLEGESISKNIDINREGLNIVPELSYGYLISNEKSFSINYAASSNPPSYLQLQPVTDVTNPQYPVTGNPTLKSELWHNVDISYNSFNIETGKTLFASVAGTFIQDQVVANTILVNKDDNIISQETLFENVNGSFMIGGSYNFSLPISERKYVVDLNGSVNYNHNISMSNSEKIGGRNLIMSQAMRMQINPGDHLEFYPSVVYTYNINRYSMGTFNNFYIDQYNSKELSTWALGASGRLNLLSGWILGIEADKNINKGFSGTGKTNPFILNTYIERRFFKNKSGALRFTGFDMFDQNTSVGRTILNNAIMDNRSNRLGRYYMLLFTLNLNKFEA
ncbi:carboxypeptidase family protein [Arcticibacter tournemirensis]|uniref:Outer membrane beta-barrel protein n=1 Tax=Arcticibacter tournemirensis TaxID=699437 RepID=A0A5M9HE60_9SPHI|nr:TonB-dependent receptor [Arcticibacter tournemirensis]KAA8483614.1 outer membrane beta-barrel protein [Arcticibacter tournemirensis]TQM51433.1 carboxypeptidase family protein [Arcticibacter tournemirensis]